MLAALLITASLAVPTTMTDHGGRPSRPAVAAPAAASDTRLAQARLADDPNAPDREIGFVDHYLPFQLPVQALPAVKDGMILSHVVGYLLPCGGLWGPVVFVEGAEFTGDVLVTYLLSGILWAVAITVVATVTVGVGLVGFLAFPYLQTTATLSAVDRDMKARGHTAPDPKTKTPPNTTTNPPANSDTPPPSYAY